jgi:hypothetical protein
MISFGWEDAPLSIGTWQGKERRGKIWLSFLATSDATLKF